MVEQRFCPQCGLEWPNFCPVDGQKLAGPWSCSNAKRAAAAKPSTPDEEARTHAIAPPAEARAAALRPVRPADVSSASGAVSGRIGTMRPDRVETTPGAKARGIAKPPATRAAPPRRAPGREQGLSDAEIKARTAATQMVEAITPELLASLQSDRARAADLADTIPDAGGGGVAAPVAAKKAKKRGKDGFSETQWFLKGVKADIEADDSGEVQVDEEAYAPDENMSPEERRKYSLRADEQEP